MNTTLSDIPTIKAMGHGQRVPEIVAKILNVARPYTRTDRDKEYGWHRQIVNLQGANGETVPMTIYSDKMHLGTENEGQVWRFRCLPSDTGPRGVEVAKWKPAGKTEHMFELKLNSNGDATRLPFMEVQEEDQGVMQTHSPEPEPAAEKAPPKTRQPRKTTPPKTQEPEVPANESGEVEELVIAEIRARRDVGRAKYGTTMERTDIDALGWLQHALEEHLDAAIYTRRLIRDLREGRLVLVPADELERLNGLVAHAKEVIDTAANGGELKVPTSKVAEIAKTETDVRIREINDKAEAELEKRRGNQRPPLDDEPPWNETKGDDRRQAIEDAEVAERNAERMSEAPVEKPGRNSSAPKGSDPFRDGVQHEIPKDANAQKNEGIEKGLNIKFVAAQTRWAYTEGASDEQVSYGHKAIKLVKDGKVTWTEAFNELVAKSRANPKEEEVVEEAFSIIKAQIGKGQPVDDDYVCECCVKNPAGFSQIFNKVRKGEMKA